MTRSPTFSPAAETTTPPQNSGPAAPRPSPPGPMSPGSSWLHNHAYRRASLSPSRFPSICRCQVDGAPPGLAGSRRIARHQRRALQPCVARHCCRRGELESSDLRSAQGPWRRPRLYPHRVRPRLSVYCRNSLDPHREYLSAPDATGTPITSTPRALPILD
jgi:hypothetical protein